MKIDQIYTECLAQGTYYIQSGNEAVIIDPLREVAPYIQKAKNNQAQIKYIFQTHFHADFVSGHLTLSEKTSAPIVYGPTANPDFDAHIAKDNETFSIGKCTIKVIHTPGHTMESTCYLLLDKNNKDTAIFTGDTLFIGDVGRPDLAQQINKLTKEDLAGMLFDSLRIKIMPLPDHITVYPAHGAGSACGKHMMKETRDTLGNQKKTNYALRADMTKEEFIQEVTDGLLSPPAYFPSNVQLNKEGYASIDAVLKKGLHPLSPNEFENLAKKSSVLMLDVRQSQEFANSHIPNSIFIGLDESFAPWVGEMVVDIKQAIILITPKGKEEEAITRLSRVGFDNTLGYLEGGIDNWINAGKVVDKINMITAVEMNHVYDKSKAPIFDLRKDAEYASKHIQKVNHIPLHQINQCLSQLPKNKTFYVHCAGNYRSMIASSILKARDIHNFANIQGGFQSLQETNIPLVP